MSAISVKGLSVSFDRKRVLTNIYLEVEAGKIYGVIGPNGAGKSTLFKAILGLLEVDNGSVKIEGKPIEKMRNDIILMGRYPHKKVFQRLNKEDKEIAMQALEEVGMTAFKDRQIGELSGGQQQRVFIARALCQESDIYFLDEPFVGVDMLTEAKIIQILKRLAQEGKTLLVVHHDLSTVRKYFDKVILLNQRMIAYGDTETVFKKDKSKMYIYFFVVP